jgi:hypothetical protein
MTVAIVFQLDPNVCEFTPLSMSYSSGRFCALHQADAGSHVLLHSVAFQYRDIFSGYSTGSVSTTTGSVSLTCCELG